MSALELSHLNHFRFGYNGEAFNHRASAADVWTVSYGKVSRPIDDWRTECVNTARLIADRAREPIWLLFSGGIDSEVVVQSFMFAGVKFKVAITRLAHELNRHDMQYAVNFCERHDLHYRCLDLDIEAFFSSGKAAEYAELTRCVQPQLLHTMWAMDQLDGYPVLGSGECLLVRENREERVAWVLYEKERIAAWYRFLMQRGRNGCAGFFQYNPENMLSFLLDEDIASSCRGERTAKSSKKMKHDIYQKYFILERRPKFHGFERVMRVDATYRPQFEKRYAAWNEIFKTPYETLIGALSAIGTLQ